MGIIDCIVKISEMRERKKNRQREEGKEREGGIGKCWTFFYAGIVRLKEGGSLQYV